jgi:hypothetical protein
VPEYADLDCRDCASSWPVAIGCASTIPGDGGPVAFSATWDGVFYVPGICSAGDAGTRACVTPTCAAPGGYTASMCACAPGDQANGACAKLSCSAVPFGYAGSAVVKGTLP